VQEVLAALMRIASARSVEASVDDLARVPVTPLDSKIRDVLKRAAKSVGVDAPELVSGAGHDAQNPALSGVPTGMIFVRSTGGSHTPREFASIDDAALGAQALANAIKELAT
jgi:acetylornithine deacetylase/succinyl-diaminopimelate desuccinylase-like protein